MKYFPINKYKFYFNDSGKVVATSTYGGRTVRGVAKCSPEDNFDIIIGKELAAARCNLKVAEKRFNRAVNKNNEARVAFYEASAHYQEMSRYVDDSVRALQEARDRVKNLEKTL